MLSWGLPVVCTICSSVAGTRYQLLICRIGLDRLKVDKVYGITCNLLLKRCTLLTRSDVDYGIDDPRGVHARLSNRLHNGGSHALDNR